MNRVLLLLLLCVAGISSCKKGFDPVAEERTQAQKDDTIIQDYIAANNLAAVTTQIDSAGTATGVYYIELKKGSGNPLFTNSTRVTVDYTAKELTTGRVFANSNNFHPSFSLGETLRAWKLAIPKMKQGGKIRVLSASRYAYGPYPQDELKLQANTVVDFEIELLDVTN